MTGLRRWLVWLGIVVVVSSTAGLAQSGKATQVPAGPPVQITQTVRNGSDGSTRSTIRSVDPGARTTVRVEPDGRVVETVQQASGQRRVLVELRARPLLDRVAQGAAAEIAGQQERLAQDLRAIDAQVLASVPAQITRQYSLLFSGVAATMSAEAADQVRLLPYVAAVHADVEVHASLTESVPLIGAPTVWSTYGVTGAGVKVAIIDTGVDYTHPDLGGCFGVGCRVVGGYDFVNKDSDPFDDHGHGTHVAGIVGANGTLKGVAPGVTFLAYKVLNSSGSGWTSDIIAGLEQAVKDGAKVANLSLGGSGDPDDPTCKAVDNATAAGMLSVIAAGNSGPGYQTIGSPGTARTALTVGASDKSDKIASFSSRGYVADGDHFLMKPEVLAPGASIRSTVPTAGSLGDPTRYKILNGTSMATPHVAGAAALLLQWKSTQTPADVKARLVATGRTLGLDPFTQGGGRIDLPKAFGLPVLASVNYLDFGAITETLGVVLRQQTLSIRNVTASAQSLSLSLGGTALPAGTTLAIAPSTITLQPGQSADVSVQLQVDVAITPDASTDPPIYAPALVIAAGAQTATVPMFFLKGPIIVLAFDRAPSFVWLINPALQVSKWFDSPAAPFSAMVSRGTWDVLVGFGGATPAIVVREQQVVEHRLSLSVQSSEAIRSVTIDAVDELQKPISQVFREDQLVLGLRNASTNDFDVLLRTGFESGRHNLSDMTSRYFVGVIGGMWNADRSRFYSYSWAGTGFSDNVTLPASGVPIRRLVQSAVTMNGATPNMSIGFAARFGWGAYAQWSGRGFLSKAIITYLQSLTAPSLPLLMVREGGVSGFDPVKQVFTDVVSGPYIRQASTGSIELDRSVFFDLLEASRTSDVTLAPGVDLWDVSLPPSSLPLRFTNSGSQLRADGRDNLVASSWRSQTLSALPVVSGLYPSLDLYRDGTLVGSFAVYYGGLYDGVTSTAGAYEVRSTLPYTITGISGSSRVVAAFDTRKTDKNPPFVSQFRIEQNDVRTATPLASAPTWLKFEATDDTALASVVLEWRPAGTTEWATLPLTRSGVEYSRVFQQAGATDLRLTVADTSGNTFMEEWTPAFVATTVTGSPLFTDDPLQSGTTLVKAVHVQEMRSLIGTLRARSGLPAYGWTEPVLAASTTTIKTVHLLELRAALNDVYDAIGRARPVYSHATITPGVTAGPTVVDMTELRAAIAAIY